MRKMIDKKTSAILIFFIILALLLPFNLAYSVEVTTLNSLIDEALKNNPQIQAAKYRYEAAKARIRLLRTLDDPKLEYEYDKINASMSNLMNNNTAPMRTFSISQEFPFPTKLFLRRASAQKEANAYEQDYKETERKVIKEVKEVYSQLFLSSKKIQLTKDNLDLLSQFIEVANKKYSVNKANQNDSLKAQVEYSKLSNQRILLEQEEEISQGRLNSLLSRPADVPVNVPKEAGKINIELTEEEIIQLAKESRPELKSYKEMVRKSEIDYSLAKQEYLPDFMVKYRREANGDKDSWAGSFGMTIPLWFWDKQDSFVKEAKANVGVANADYRAEENVILFEAKASLVRFEAAKKLVDVYETGILPQALASLQTAQRGYEADKISFLDLLDSLRSLKDFQMEYFEAQANVEIAFADLERTIGTDIAQ